ncbi:hypothetical protein GGQ84_000117 [Desulfitispora alkaliphila]
MVMRHLRRKNAATRKFFMVLALLIIAGLVGSSLVGVFAF